MTAKKTPLYDEHVKLGGKVVDYAGWLLPVQYQGLVPEHEAVRNKVGMFDISHMGEINVKGKDAEKFLDYLLTNDISKMVDNQVVYTFMCEESGGVVDDLLTYKYNDESFLLVVNASNSDKDFKWMTDLKNDFDVEIENVSDETGALAIQGPYAEKTLQKLVSIDLSTIKPFTLVQDVDVNGVKSLISRTGYTGEDGFEVYTTPEGIVKVWRDLMEAGKEFDIQAAGLGCRDTLRFEASLPLYGHEISETVNPLEGSFKFFVKLKKESDFIGKEALNKAWDEGLERKLCGFELLGRGIPRENYEIFKDGEKIGYVTTGYMSPTLKKNIGNALVKIEETEIGNEFDVMIRNKPVKAKVINRNFLKNR